MRHLENVFFTPLDFKRELWGTGLPKSIKLMQTLVSEKSNEPSAEEEIISEQEPMVSFVQDLPSYLKDALTAFIEEHPNWDQYRLIQAAISGYLLKNGFDSREVNRIYFENMFSKRAFGENL